MTITKEAEQAYISDRREQLTRDITDYNRFHKWISIRLQEDELNNGIIASYMPTTCKTIPNKIKRNKIQQIKNWSWEWLIP